MFRSPWMKILLCLIVLGGSIYELSIGEWSRKGWRLTGIPAQLMACLFIVLSVWLIVVVIRGMLNGQVDDDDDDDGGIA